MGQVQPKGEVLVSSQIQAQVRQVLVRPGQRVRRGEILLELDDRELRARLTQGSHDLDALKSALRRAANILERAQAEFDLAEAEFTRIESLHASGAAATRELDQARAAFLSARAEIGQAEQGIQELEARGLQLEQRVQELEVALGHTRITAVENGIIARRSVEPGDVVHPGQTLLLLHSPDLHLEVHLPERFHQWMRLGAEFTARVDALEHEFRAVVDEFEPMADGNSRTFEVKLAVLSDAPDILAALQPGMFARVRIPLASEESVLIPIRAVLRVGQLELVAVVHDEAFSSLRHIRLGHAHGELIEVLAGLEGGERLWLNPTPVQ